MDKIDFRSDTVTWPTPSMRHAMASAPLGDDVYGEDPTVNKLEAEMANLVGMEAGLFVSSGTMGNLVSVLAHTQRGDEAILSEASHINNWEAGNIAAVGGVMPRLLPVDSRGRMNVTEIGAAVRGDDPHLPRTSLIGLENTAGGRFAAAIEPAYFRKVRHVADQHQLPVHLDGARLFNAVVKQGINVTEITNQVDSVSICLSKGLCAPVGTVVCGSAEFIHTARRRRKMLGGGMRQAGILAAAGLVAIEENIERLADDHRRARDLANGLATIDGVNVDLDTVHTNMVFFHMADGTSKSAAQVANDLRERHGIWVGAEGYAEFRAVTHYWIDDAAVAAFVEGMRDVVA